MNMLTLMVTNLSCMPHLMLRCDTRLMAITLCRQFERSVVQSLIGYLCHTDRATINETVILKVEQSSSIKYNNWKIC